MAYIPYGYKIERGRAVIDDIAKEKINTFVRLYLDGASVQRARDQAGMNISLDCAKGILDRKLYRGSGYYPAILDPDTSDRILSERRRRAAKLQGRKSAGPKKAVPVYRTFTFDTQDIREDTSPDIDPAERAAYLYSCIRPSRDGSENIPSGKNISAGKNIPSGKKGGIYGSTCYTGQNESGRHHTGENRNSEKESGSLLPGLHGTRGAGEFL